MKKKSLAIMQAIGEVWTAIITWIVSAIQALVPVFYSAETGFTFIGVLAVIGLGLGVVFLVIGVIQNFLRLRS